MARTEDLNNYLSAKHRGGVSNWKGGLYEDYYAVYQIVSCLAKYKHELDSVSFQAQLEDTFVDDLLISYSDVNIYHQLKNTKTVVWGSTDKKGDIAFDFARQIEECEDRDEGFALKLIYSAKGSSVADNIPEAIKTHSSAIERCKLLVVVKSIISSSCVVKTQLTRLIGKIHPERIAVMAPVMYKDGAHNLMKEFPEEIVDKFHFVTFAIDEERTEKGEVVPGIGGMVYPRLGLGDMDEKNSYIPQMVLERI